jgi:FMN phosphatase YigB (HAD superfamily)
MNKPIIAIDCDDVLSASAEAFIAFSNNRWGTNLTVDDFQEDWGKMWKLDHEKSELRVDEFHSSGAISDFRRYDEALPVLQHLKQDYNLVVLTSRNRPVDAETRAWLDREYSGIFDHVYFSGIYDSGLKDGRAYKVTKAGMLKKIGASYIIDDQIKHCIGALEAGVKPILYGDYPWNQDDSLDAGITRCIKWNEVRVYFDSLKQ